MRVLLFALPLALSACVSAPPFVDAYDRTIADMRALVIEHASAADAATSLEAIKTSESAYQASWADLMGQLANEMATMDACTMTAGKRTGVAMGMMEDADAGVAMMDHDMSLHMAGHGDHTDVTECQAEESDHLDAMTAALDDMASYAETWRETRMSCPET